MCKPIPYTNLPAFYDSQSQSFEKDGMIPGVDCILSAADWTEISHIYGLNRFYIFERKNEAMELRESKGEGHMGMVGGRKK